MSFGATGAQLATTEAEAAQTSSEPVDNEPARFDSWLVAPRAAAVAVLGMLGFGVLVGSMVAESAATSNPALIIARSGGSSSGSGNSALGASGSIGGGGAAAGGGGGGTRTITVGSTTPAPSQGGGGSGGGGGNTGSSPSVPNSGSNTSTPGALPPIKHVFLIMLSDQGYSQTFGHTSADPYLAGTLAKQGEVVQNYYAVAQSELANEVALMSGQGPTQDTLSNCPTYSDITPGKEGKRGQVLGNGCVYPQSTKTLTAELTTAHQQWRAYFQTARKTSQLCQIPKAGQADPTQPAPGDAYVHWRDPFLYFKGLTGSSTCDGHHASLTRLQSDLLAAKTTPALSYIVPDLCHDGSDTPCQTGAAAGMGPAEQFLKTLVPEIKSSPGYKAGGLIAITFDQAPQSGPNADQSSCCGNPTYPNVPASGTPGSGTSTSSSTTTSSGTTTSSTTGGNPATSTTTSGTTPTTTAGTTTTTSSTSTGPSLGDTGVTSPTGGGGQVGLLLISKYITPGSVEVTDYFNHFSLLASLEQLLKVPRIGYASDPALPLFGNAVYTGYTG